MKEHPIIFSSPMVRAILEPRKTMTRRPMKPQPSIDPNRIPRGYSTLHDPKTGEWKSPYGQHGDRLWVRETWVDDVVHGHYLDGTESGEIHHNIFYKADELSAYVVGHKWRPSIFMPRWASRITLEITNIRIERLQEITEEDAIKEGCKFVQPTKWWQGYREMEGTLHHEEYRGDDPPHWMIEPKLMNVYDPCAYTGQQDFRIIWQSIYGPDSWSQNPWVWVIEFKKIGG